MRMGACCLATDARRRLLRLRPPFVRRAMQMLSMLLAAAVFVAPAVAWSDGVVSATFGDPTRRYGHAILGDDIEYGSLTIVGRPGLGRWKGSLNTPPVWGENEFKITLPLDHVFEDIQPRLVDIDLDGGMEVMVVETDVAKGAQLAIYDGAGKKIAETPHIGRSNRWLAPIGAVDFDGDGYVEVAYVDRPHLAKVLRVWRYRDGRLEEVANHAGLTNHQIGQDFITSGLRDCGDGAEMVLVDAEWSRIVSVRLRDDQLDVRELGQFASDPNLKETLACR